MPSPSARPTFLETLPPELQIRVLACLSTKERARLPLVCQALNKLANDPHSLLWEALDLRVTLQNKDAALHSGTRRLLQARGQRTKRLGLRISGSVPANWRNVFANVLPPLYPELQELAVADCAYDFQAEDVKSLVRACSRLRALDIALSAEGFAEAVASVCELTGLTDLRLASTGVGETGSELQEEALQPLQRLTGLRRLDIARGTGYAEFCFPACLPKHLLRLESLSLEGSQVHLPATFSESLCLTNLKVDYCKSWANLWLAVSGLPALQALELDFAQFQDALAPFHAAAFSSCLTGLTCCSGWGVVNRFPVAGDPLALPALQALSINFAMAPCLSWPSLTAMQSLTCTGQGDDTKHIWEALKGLSRLTSLKVSDGESVTEVHVAEMCQVKGLRRLELVDTYMEVLPECLGSARLTALHLLTNYFLNFGPAVYRVLESMPCLQILRVCVCNVKDEEAPAIQSQSLTFLSALGKGLHVCETCVCQDEAWQVTPM